MKLQSMVRDHKLEPVTWAQMLDSASSWDEMRNVIRDFLATWEPLELGALPKECTPPAFFVQPEDVVNHAFVLVQYHCGPGAGNDLVFRMAHFFSAASRRVAAIMSEAPSAGADNEGD